MYPGSDDALEPSRERGSALGALAGHVTRGSERGTGQDSNQDVGTLRTIWSLHT